MKFRHSCCTSFSNHSSSEHEMPNLCIYHSVADSVSEHTWHMPSTIRTNILECKPDIYEMSELTFMRQWNKHSYHLPGQLTAWLKWMSRLSTGNTAIIQPEDERERDSKYCYEYKLTYNYARYCECPWDITPSTIAGRPTGICLSYRPFTFQPVW